MKCVLSVTTLLFALAGPTAHAQTPHLVIDAIEIPKSQGRYYTQENLLDWVRSTEQYRYWAQNNKHIVVKLKYGVIGNQYPHAYRPDRPLVVLNEGFGADQAYVFEIDGTLFQNGSIATHLELRQSPYVRSPNVVRCEKEKIAEWTRLQVEDPQIVELQKTIQETKDLMAARLAAKDAALAKAAKEAKLKQLGTTKEQIEKAIEEVRVTGKCPTTVEEIFGMIRVAKEKFNAGEHKKFKMESFARVKGVTPFWCGYHTEFKTWTRGEKWFDPKKKRLIHSDEMSEDGSGPYQYEEIPVPGTGYFREDNDTRGVKNYRQSGGRKGSYDGDDVYFEIAPHVYLQACGWIESPDFTEKGFYFTSLVFTPEFFTRKEITPAQTGPDTEIKLDPQNAEQPTLSEEEMNRPLPNIEDLQKKIEQRKKEIHSRIFKDPCKE